MAASPVCPLHYAPLAPVAAAFTVGILLDRFAKLPFPGVLFVAWLGLVLCAAARRSRFVRIGWLVTVCLLGASLHNLECEWTPADSVLRHLGTDPVLSRVRGQLIDDWTVRAPPKADPLVSRPREETSTTILKLKEVESQGAWMDVSGKVRLSVPGRMTSIQVGDEVELLGWLELPSKPLNPGGWDYARWLRDQGVVAELHVRKTGEGIVRLDTGGAWFARLLARVRHWGQEVLEKNLQGPEYGLASALLLGQNQALSSGEWEQFVRTGVIHVLAISGQHLVILAFALRFLFRLAGLNYRTIALLLAVSLFSYALLTGARPSALRAAIMVACACLAVLLHRRAFPANTFALAWLLVLVVQPGDLFTSGFQLSFLAVAVLIWGIPIWLPPKPEDPLQRLIEESEPPAMRFGRSVWRIILRAYLTTTLICLALLPLIIHWHNLISFSGLLIGPPLILLSTVALLAGFALLIDAAFGGLMSFTFAGVLKFSLAWSNDLVTWADGWAWGCWYVGPIPTASMIAFYVVLLAWFAWSKWKDYPLPIPGLENQHFLKALLVCVLSIFAIPQRQHRGDELRIDFLAVGHGGCTVLELPDGRVILYDAGSLAGPEVAARTIAPYLWHRGITRIDEILVSHADLDHFNAVSGLLKRFAVGRVTLTPSFKDKPTPGVQATLADIERRKVEQQTLFAPNTWEAAGVKFTVLHPPSEGPTGIENERSLTILLEHKGHRVLLTGDLERSGLSKLLVLPSMPVDVLMAPHHGSATAFTPELLAWARPRQVIVNDADGPTARRLNGMEPTTWITGVQGAVTFRSHATGLVAEAYATGERRVITAGGK